MLPTFALKQFTSSSNNIDQCVYHKAFRRNGMIPIPPSSNQKDTLSFYKAVVDNLKIRSGHHEAWHTHKRDTSVCWICDLQEVSTILISEMERYISKSALDIDDQFHDSEVISEDEEVNASTSQNRSGDI